MSSDASAHPAPTRGVLARVAILAAAVTAGLVLHAVLAARLDAIQALSQTDLLAARASLAQILEVTAVGLFGATGALGVAIVLACRKSLALLHTPAPGRLSWGARKAVTGPPARRRARIGMALGIALVLASAAAGGLTWYMAVVLRACRAGVPLA
jgi:hypothetical protein